MPVLISAEKVLDLSSILNKAEIIPADEAFILRAYETEKNRIILSWELKENCFLYKNKFKIESNSGSKIDLEISGVPVNMNDEYFGRVLVYYDKVQTIIDLKPHIRKFRVYYQGCNASGFCYPLISKEITIHRQGITVIDAS
tara:strand:+ start:9897 stop:10322 length:426 start_codon:yes stop_codon:yes gene_type:complete